MKRGGRTRQHPVDFALQCNTIVTCTWPPKTKEKILSRIMIGRPLLIPRPISQDQHPQLPVLHAAFYLCRQQGVTYREPILAFFYLSLLTFRSVQWKYYGGGIRLHVRAKLSIDLVGLSIETLASKTVRPSVGNGYRKLHLSADVPTCGEVHHHITIEAEH